MINIRVYAAIYHVAVYSVWCMPC